MVTIIQLLIGAVFCVVFVVVVRQAGVKREMRIYAVGLASSALIYVGFALLGGAPRSWLILEVGGFVLFSLVALLGLRRSMWFVVVGWAAHPVWDVVLHKVLSVGFVPEWYPVGCAGFDLLLAVYIARRVREKRWLDTCSLANR